MYTTGCGDETCYADTWAFDTNNAIWSLLVNASSQSVPRGRTTSAGGIYPGQNELWLSMGENTFGRKFSDTWVLNVNTSGPELSGMDQYA